MTRTTSRFVAAIAVICLGTSAVRVSGGDDGPPKREALPAPAAAACAASGPPSVCDPTPATVNSTAPDPPPPKLDPYQDEITFPLPKATPLKDADGVEHYRITMKRSQTQLHSQIPHKTDIFGYEGRYPGPTFDVKMNKRVVVEWVNGITDEADPSKPKHILTPVVVTPTPTVPFPQDWPANPKNATPSSVPPAPIWTVVHLHGASTMPGSDGYPDDAYPYPQSAVYSYGVESRATTLWYHDHADMITRLNVGAGLAGFYLVRDDVEDQLGLPRGGKDELPLLIQDRNLALDDQNRFTGAMLHLLANDGAEFYGPYTLVNGKIWPYARVEPRQIRLRLLNGSNGRFYRLKLKDDKGVTSTEQFRQIGSDSGLLDGPVAIPEEGLTLAPAERADVILNLKDYAGKSVSLVNDYPIPMAPVVAGTKNVPDKPIHEEVIQFRVADKCTTPDTLNLPKMFVPKYFKSPRHKKSEALRTRPIYLIEDPPGTLTINGRLFQDHVEEVVHLGDTEIWEIINTTGDFHPIHLHLVDFEVIERRQFGFAQGLDVDKWVPLFRLWQAADPRVRLPQPPGIIVTDNACKVDDNEKGLKDTVRAGPMAVTRILINFGPHTGRYVYHCHILEHEDMEMMRPYLILPPGLDLMGPNLGPGTTLLPSGGGMPARGMTMPSPGMVMPRPVEGSPGHEMMPGPRRTVRRRVP